jgi:4-amino-4-deoxy-L-arabinose transferase-like glycosyltransferase
VFSDLMDAAQTSETRPNWLAAHPRTVIVAIVVVCLAPFLNRAVAIDDPLFLWTAKWIQTHPGNFFGFTVNWFGTEMPMGATNFNPPLTSYLLALVGSIFGWHEIMLHGAFLLVAVAAALGIYSLAAQWCTRPLLATLIAFATPVFFVSSTTLMCDVPMFALWIWSVSLWERGLTTSRVGLLFAAGLLAGLAILTKYSALTFLPVLFLLGAVRTRRIGWWLAALAIPPAMLAGYEVITTAIYQRGLFSIASEYAAANRVIFEGGWTSKWIIGFVFGGGCLLPALFFAPSLWRPWRVLAAGAALFGVFLAVIAKLDRIGPLLLIDDKKPWQAVLQIALLGSAGVFVLALAALEWWKRRDATTTVLAFWILEGFAFATVLNWTISGRSLLPIVPAVAILMVRRLEGRLANANANWRLLSPLAPSAIATLLIATADLSLSNSARTAAREITAKYSSGSQIWFQGHWGFQYYMQELGARALDFQRSIMQPGDVLIVPPNNSNTMIPDADAAEARTTLEYPICDWLSLMHRRISGFYAADWGPLPFALGLTPPESYWVYTVKQPFIIGQSPAQLRNALRYGEVLHDSSSGTNSNSDVETLGRKATELESAGKFAEAIEAYRKAEKLSPDNLTVLNNLAWILASNPDAALRDGPEAVRLATKAAELSNRKQPVILGTLAAAYATNGQFEKATETAESARDLALALGDKGVAADNERLLKSYRARKAAFEPGP